MLPALSLFGWWDAYLSSALYSGNTAQAIVYVDQVALRRFPDSVREHIWQKSEPMFLDVNRWSYGELNVPAYPALRVLRQVGHAICRDHSGLGKTVLRIFHRPDWRSGKRDSEFCDCSVPGC